MSCLTCGGSVPKRRRPSLPERRYCSIACYRRRPARSLDERFWSMVDRSAGPDACWIWLGAKLPVYRYGGFGITRHLIVRAHRWIFERLHGPIPAGLHVRHRCDNPPCVNPAHLELGTPRENTQDIISRGRWPKTKPSMQGERNHNAKLTADAVRVIRQARAAGVAQPVLAARYGVTSTLIRLIEQRRAWRHVA